MHEVFSIQTQVLIKPTVFIFKLFCVFLQSEQNIVASFDRKGEYIYTGNSKGKVSDDVATSKRWCVCGRVIRF